MTNGVFALAVYLAIATKEEVYVGALVAFMMLTGRVAQPLIQLSQMITQYDEVRLAVQVIGKLVNQPPEEGRSEYGVRTPIRGRVEFADVRFRYPGTTSPALDGCRSRSRRERSSASWGAAVRARRRSPGCCNRCTAITRG